MPILNCIVKLLSMGPKVMGSRVSDPPDPTLLSTGFTLFLHHITRADFRYTNPLLCSEVLRSGNERDFKLAIS